MNNERNDIKKKEIHLRVSEKEKKVFMEKAKQAGYKTLAQYIRCLLTDKVIPTKTDLQTVLQIRKIGTNINQIAHLCNEHKTSDIILQVRNDLLKEIEKLDSIISEIKERK